MGKISLKEFTEDDITSVHAFLEAYLKEAKQADHLTYSPEVSDETFFTIASSEGHGGLIIYYNNIICGFAAWQISRSWFEELEAYIDMFFIHPDMRGTQAARTLLAESMKLLEASGAKIVYSSCECGIGEVNNTLYKNLYKKQDFEELGTGMWRFL